jgi:hypothetical protein
MLVTRFSLGKQLLQGDCLHKLELHLGARANEQRAGSMSIPRLSRRPRRASRLKAVGLYRDIASEIDVSSRVSGSFLRGLARDDLIFPNAFVPDFKRTCPFTATSWSIFAAKVLPTGSCEERELTVCTASVVPAGIAAALNDEAAQQAHIIAITVMNLSRIIRFEWL